MKQLMNRLKKLREEHNLTQDELAEAVGSCRDTIGRLERNQFKNPSYPVIYDIAQYFGVPVETIFWYKNI